MSRREESKSIKRSMIKTVVIVIAIIISLAIIYRFNFLTKSEITNRIPITAYEMYSDKVVSDDIEIYKDENGEYIILPEKISGYYVDNYYVKEIDYLW